MSTKHLKIPKTFTLFGETWDVELDDKLVESDGCVGKCIFQARKIKIQTPSKSNHVTETLMYRTFLHELVHAILAGMEEGGLNSDEKFVNIAANLLGEALSSQSKNLLTK